MILAGNLDAQQVAGRWVVDPGSLRRSAPLPGRPMSARIAWGLLLGPDREPSGWLRADEAYRIRRRMDRLRLVPDALAVVRAWVPGRSEVRHLQAQDIPGLLADGRVVPSGVSDPRSGMSAASFAEVYVHADDADDLLVDHLLVPVPRARANVRLHVALVLPPAPVPELLVIADLADADGPREEGRARELLRAWLAAHQNDGGA
ncbi:hypothetical protein ATL42_2411 [Sanguibacter antarcticus]|uniref:Uncharacterized protein n=2 Tax=Sanguibacter antarcticus TaxID=372484 RepID=A0A2A9E8K6_9MICO|nr:hypothetical protein ATL42_2411 [Sanguibacter antarcticus]